MRTIRSHQRLLGHLLAEMNIAPITPLKLPVSASVRKARSAKPDPREASLTYSVRHRHEAPTLASRSRMKPRLGAIISSQL